MDAPQVKNLKIQIFADGAELKDFRELCQLPIVKGFTTNPSLMRKAGVKDYEPFAHTVLGLIGDRPVSFEVFADDFVEMERQARKIGAWGKNVYVKIPITNTKRESALPLIKRLLGDGIQVNITAIMTLDQVSALAKQTEGMKCGSVVSVFAGRIADTGRDPVPLMAEAKKMLSRCPRAELLWASPRELLNVFQANEIGCDIITVTPDILKKLAKVGASLDDFSLDTVKVFYTDAQAAGYRL